MRSDNIKNTEEKAEITEVSAVDSDVKKQRFGLKIFPETLRWLTRFLSMITVSHALNSLKKQLDFTAVIF